MNSKQEKASGRALYFNKPGRIVKDDKSLNEAFMAAIGGDVATLQTIFDQGASLNYQDYSGTTPLLKASAMNARYVIRALVSSGEVDYLLRDNQGRLASQLSFPRPTTHLSTMSSQEWKMKMSVYRLLAYKERQQALVQGVSLWEEHRKSRAAIRSIPG